MMAVMILAAGLFATKEGGIAAYAGWAIALAAAAAIIREFASPRTIGHNVIALALSFVPGAIWYQVASGFDLRHLIGHLAYIGLVVFMAWQLVKTVRHGDAASDTDVLKGMTNFEDPRERPTPESEKKPGGEERAEDDPHFNDPVREAIDSEGNPEEKRGPQDDEFHD